MSGLGAGRDVRWGFCERAASIASNDSRGVIRVMSIVRNIVISIYFQRDTTLDIQSHTCNSHPVTPFQWIPHHGPVCYRYKSFRNVLRARCECAYGGPRATQYEGLEPGWRHGSVGHRLEGSV